MAKLTNTIGFLFFQWHYIIQISITPKTRCLLSVPTYENIKCVNCLSFCPYDTELCVSRDFPVWSLTLNLSLTQKKKKTPCNLPQQQTSDTIFCKIYRKGSWDQTRILSLRITPSMNSNDLMISSKRNSFIVLSKENQLIDMHVWDLQELLKEYCFTNLWPFTIWSHT